MKNGGDVSYLSVRAADELAAAMRAESRASRAGAKPVIPAHPAPAKPPALRDGDVHLGAADDTGAPIGIDLRKLLDGRLLIQGVSGAGKSWTLRRLVELTHGRLPQIVVDPEGEFSNLGAALGHIHIDAARLDGPGLAELALRAREHRLSLVLDLSDLEREDQMRAVAAFCGALVGAPQKHWSPALVFIDEVHVFAPFGGQVDAVILRRAATGAITDLMSRGRKRGLCGILATQRLARLAKSVASEAQNFLVGLNTLDVDIRRAAETIGWDAKRAFDRLPMLEPGHFAAVGAAFSRSPAVVAVGPVRTQHRGAAPALMAPPEIAAAEAAQLLDIEALAGAAAQAAALRQETALLPGIRALRGFIRDPAFCAAARIFGALVPLAPDGARIAELAAHCGLVTADAAAALALLDGAGALEFRGDGAERSVRIGKGMLP